MRRKGGKRQVRVVADESDAKWSGEGLEASGSREAVFLRGNSLIAKRVRAEDGTELAGEL